MRHDLPDPESTATIAYDPTFERLRALSEAMETTTEFGSPAYVSEFTSRSADRTKNAVDDEITEEDEAHVERALTTLREEAFVCLDRRLGAHPDLSFTCRLFVPEAYARIALSWATLLEPADPGAEPDMQTVQIPDWGETRIRAFPDDGVTYVLGSDYTGEAKKSFLRLFMFEAKRRGGLGLHAGSKRVRVLDGRGECDERGDACDADADDGLRSVGQLFLGLSATGKTTLTCHGLGLTDPEGAELVQDDVCALLPDGTVAGSEGGGLYIKTLGLSPDEQPELYRAATSEDAVLENVVVGPDGSVDFDDDSITSNGRASIRRADLPGAADSIDLSSVDHVFFITRNRLMAPVARLSPEEAAAAFVLGESIQTSAGDPEKAGESVRVVGTNPFIVGSPGEEGNRFLELVRDADVECFLLNTGEVGYAEPRSVGVEESVAILEAIARGRVEWRPDARLGLELPEHVEGVDVEAFYPPALVDDFEERLAALRAERREYLGGFPALDSAIVETSLAVPLGRTRSE